MNKVVRDLETFQLINPDDEGSVRIHLTRLAVACLEEGKRLMVNRGEKEVIEYDENNHEIETYPSGTIAARINGMDKTTLYTAIWEKRATRNGHLWKYAENE